MQRSPKNLGDTINLASLVINPNEANIKNVFVREKGRLKGGVVITSPRGI